MNALSANKLTRRFGDLVAVDDVTFDVPAGRIVGFVGPNGSGKSTTIRVLLGLIAPTSGSGTVLGEPIDHPERFAANVGALIESPTFVGSMTGRDNLRSLAALRGVPARRISDVIDIVGLAGRDRDRVSTYSLGMKQRLGIAAALLPDPALLILDEPTNGLDPAGIVEIRGLLKELAADGRTIVVSSHLLSELEALVDHLVVIRFGKLLYHGTLEDLLSQAAVYVVAAPEHAADLDRLAGIADSRGWSSVRHPSELHVGIQAEHAAELNRAALENGIALRVLTPHRETLEDVFLRMTGATDGELARHRSTQRTGGRQ